MTILPAHRFATRRLRIALDRVVVPQGWYVESPSPVTLATSEPEPDVAVVRGSDQDYIDRHPGPADVVLVVEVSDNSLHRDQASRKGDLCQGRHPYILDLQPDRSPRGSIQRPDRAGNQPGLPCAVGSGRSGSGTRRDRGARGGENPCARRIADSEFIVIRFKRIWQRLRPNIDGSRLIRSR